MLIAGIRHQINAELDSRRSTTFVRYLIYYLQMFAFMGIIFPVVIGVDYFCTPEIKDEIVTNKFSILINLNQTEYHINTNSFNFLSNAIFYENTKIQDHVSLVCTPIFHTVTNVSNYHDRIDYKCKPKNLYDWPIIIAALTFVCSIIYFVKTWGWIRKRKQIKYETIINLGIINSLLCIFIIITTFLGTLI